MKAVARARAISIGLYGTFVVAQLLLLLRKNGGELTYTLDDAYIHLAVARNLATHGVLGVEPGVWASASSSPLWTFLLAPFAYAPRAVFVAAPLVLNVAAAVGLLAVLARDVAALPRALERDLAAAALPFVTLTAGLTLAGMEATLFSLAAVLFLLEIAGRRRPVQTAALTVAIALLRPEGVVLAATAAAVVFPVNRRTALTVLAVAIASIATFGVWNMAHGDSFLANSVSARTLVARMAGEGALAYARRLISFRVGNWAPLTRDGAVAWMALVVLVVALVRWSLLDHAARIRVQLALAAVTMHAFAANTNAPLSRYQSYLLALLAAALLRSLPITMSRTAWSGLLIASAIAFHRPLRQQALAARASHEIWLQQRVMARFLTRAFPGETVMLNDIGAVAFLRPGPLIDLCGLGSSVVERMRREGRWTAESATNLARNRGVRFVVVYEDWMRVDAPCGPGPTSMHAVATWTIPSPTVVVSSPTVTFFAIEDAAVLKTALRNFESQLPHEVTVRYSP